MPRNGDALRGGAPRTGDPLVFLILRRKEI
jgi:hypothetical protein